MRRKIISHSIGISDVLVSRCERAKAQFHLLIIEKRWRYRSLIKMFSVRVDSIHTEWIHFCIVHVDSWTYLGFSCFVCTHTISSIYLFIARRRMSIEHTADKNAMAHFVRYACRINTGRQFQRWRFFCFVPSLFIWHTFARLACAQ